MKAAVALTINFLRQYQGKLAFLQPVVEKSVV